jgi:hypothetical protein
LVAYSLKSRYSGFLYQLSHDGSRSGMVKEGVGSQGLDPDYNTVSMRATRLYTDEGLTQEEEKRKTSSRTGAGRKGYVRQLPWRRGYGCHSAMFPPSSKRSKRVFRDCWLGGCILLPGVVRGLFAWTWNPSLRPDRVQYLASVPLHPCPCIRALASRETTDAR